MKMEIYTIYDEAVQAFGTPMFCKTMLEMNRELHHFINHEEKNSIMQMYPQQFILYKLGNWDYSTGKFELLEQPVRLYSLNNLVNNFDDIEEEENTILKEVE